MQKPVQCIFVMTDSQGADMVGAYSGRDMGTVTLDRLAAEGVRFDRAYTTCPLCTPARSALFTGTWSHTNGAWANEQPIGYNVPNIGRHLQKAGIRTGYIGKWHLAATDYFGDGTCPAGWDPEYWFDGRNHLDSLPDELRTFSREVHTSAEMEAAGFTVEHTYAHGCVERARDFVRRYAAESFFLVVSLDEPHHPFLAPGGWYERFEEFEIDRGPSVEEELSNKPVSHRRMAQNAGGMHTRDGRKVRHPAYFGCNAFVDNEIGRLVDAIDDHCPGATVIYTSDHGEMIGAHRMSGKGQAMYEEITRIPLIVRGGEWSARAGEVESAPASHMDIPRTVFASFGLTPPPVVGGRDLAHLRGGNDPVFIDFTRFNTHIPGPFCPVRAAVDGRYKMAINLLQTDELYDLANDPWEVENLIDSDDPVHRAARERLHAAILAWMDGTNDPFYAPEWHDRHWGHGSAPAKHGRVVRPDDGFEVTPLAYNTGRPVR